MGYRPGDTLEDGSGCLTIGVHLSLTIGVHLNAQASTFGTPQQRFGCQRRNHNRFLRLNNFMDRLSQSH